MRYKLKFYAATLVFLVLSLMYYLYINDSAIFVPRKDSVVLDLIIKDHRFIPETLFAPPKTPISIRVYNQDSTVEEFESHDLKREKIVPPKSKVVIRLPGLKPGAYGFFGEFHEETATGKLIIKADVKNNFDKQIQD